MQNITRQRNRSITAGTIKIPGRTPWVKIWVLMVDTENNDPTDDLLSITGGEECDIAIVMCKNSARAVVMKNNTADPSGNKLQLSGDFSLTQRADKIMLIKIGTSPEVWHEISRSNNA